MSAHVAPPDRYAGVAMAVRLVALIRDRGLTLRELAERLDVCERTVRRLIDALRAGGIEIQQARGGSEASRLVYRVRDEKRSRKRTL